MLCASTGFDAESQRGVSERNRRNVAALGAETSHHRHHVVADFVSFATAFSFSKQPPSLIHSAAPPFQIEPASLGFDLGTAFVVIIIRIKPPGALLGSGWFAVCDAVRIFPRRGSLLFSGTADIMTIK